jgi:DNA-binding transcriptional LysR family regulator
LLWSNSAPRGLNRHGTGVERQSTAARRRASRSRIVEASSRAALAASIRASRGAWAAVKARSAARLAGSWRFEPPATASATILPPAIAAMRTVNPRLELRLLEADPPAAIPLLTGGDCDLALVYVYPILRRPDETGIDLEALFADQMALAVPVGHPLAGAERVSLLALAAESWVAPHDSVCRDALVFACRVAGFEPRLVSETNDSATAHEGDHGSIGGGSSPITADGGDYLAGS